MLPLHGLRKFQTSDTPQCLVSDILPAGKDGDAAPVKLGAKRFVNGGEHLCACTVMQPAHTESREK